MKEAYQLESPLADMPQAKVIVKAASEEIEELPLPKSLTVTETKVKKGRGRPKGSKNKATA